MTKQNRKNTSKKVLMICYFFPPCPHVGALRSAKFVKYLGKFGWHCEVLTAYSRGVKEYKGNENVNIHSTLRINLDAVVTILVSAFYFCRNLAKKLWRIPRHKKHTESNTISQSNLKTKGGLGIATYLQRWLLIPDGKIIWTFFALPQALWFARKCDIIYSSASPFSAHVLGLLIKKLTHKPWVADYRDEWSLSCIWNPPTKFHRWLGEKLDKACVENADIIVNVTEIRTQMFIDKFGGDEKKFVTIHNGYDENDVAKFRKTNAPTDTLVMTSIGSLYGGRNAKPFLRAAVKAIENGEIERQKLNINLIGGLNPDLVSEVEKLGLNDVTRILPRMSQEKAFAELAKSHLAILVGSEMEKVAMTTKVYEYAGLGKPIFALVPQGPVHDFVNECGGWCADCSNEEEILKTITTIFEQYKNGKLQSYNSPELTKNYERSTLTNQLADWFNSLYQVR